MSGQDPAQDAAPPPQAEAGRLGDDAQAVLSAARETARAYAGTLGTLRRLFAAEVGLARDALVHGLVYLLVATVMLGTVYVLLTALVVTGLRSAGAPWPLAIAIPLLASAGIGGFAVMRARAALRLADFEATRRQLKLGLRGVADPESTP